MIDGKNGFDQPIKDNKITYENIRKVSTGQGGDCTTACLLDYIYFKNYYKMIGIGLSKQQALEADPDFINIKMTQYNSLNVKLSNSHSLIN